MKFKIPKSSNVTLNYQCPTVPIKIFNSGTQKGRRFEIPETELGKDATQANQATHYREIVRKRRGLLRE